MTSARRRVLIVGDRRRPGVADGVRRHRARLAERVEVVGEDLDERIDLAKAEADLVLVFGGDGSILHVARRLGTNPIPVLGVNYGRFGFLADLAPEQLDEGIDRWLEGAAELHRRTRLDVTWLRSDGVGGRWLALNDVVVGRSELGRMVDVDVGIDGHHTIKGTGMRIGIELNQYFFHENSPAQFLSGNQKQAKRNTPALKEQGYEFNLSTYVSNFSQHRRGEKLHSSWPAFRQQKARSS